MLGINKMPILTLPQERHQYLNKRGMSLVVHSPVLEFRSNMFPSGYPSRKSTANFHETECCFQIYGLDYG